MQEKVGFVLLWIGLVSTVHCLQCGLTLDCSTGACGEPKRAETITIDLSQMKRDDRDYSKLSYAAWNWYANVCGNTINTCEGLHAVAYKTDDLKPSSCVILGRDITQQDPTTTAFTLIEPGNPDHGVQVTYGLGSKDGCPEYQQVTFRIRCGPASNDIVAVETTDACHTVMSFTSPFACPSTRQQQASSPSAPASPGAPGTPAAPSPAVASHEMGGFTLFLLLLLMGLCAYCAIFSLYNYQQGERGIGVLPHPDFWCDSLPNCVKGTVTRCTECTHDLCVCTAERVRGAMASHSGGGGGGSGGGSWFSVFGKPSGSGAAEYERIRDVRIVSHASANTNTDTNFYDVERDADLDDIDDDEETGKAPPPVAAPAASKSSASLGKSSSKNGK